MPRIGRRDLVFALTALGAVVVASVLGQIATFPNLAPWYASLAKPAFNPQNWVFAPVWTALYVLMALAFWRILRLPPQTPGRTWAVAFFIIQLTLNAAWSWMFFAAHSPLLGLVDIVPQLTAIVVTVALFARLDTIAGLCMVPLVLWVAFAAVLNHSIWSLNT
jgi:tryptophan-rich sensory protein